LDDSIFQTNNGIGLVMDALLRKFLPTSFTLAIACLSSNVFAGSATPPTITYGPLASASVPTLGGSALIVLAILLAVIAFRVMRSQQHTHIKLVVALTTTAAIASGIGGIELISDASATGENILLQTKGGGSVTLVCAQNNVTNATDVPQEIKKIQLNGNSSGSVSNQCKEGTVLAENGEPNNICLLDIFCPT
jgi:hypothetical protein